MKKPLKSVIKEELNKRMVTAVFRLMSRYIGNEELTDDEETYDDLIEIYNNVRKQLSLKLGWQEENEFRDMIIGSFIQTGHGNIKDPSFIFEPKKKNFGVEGWFSYDEYGVKTVKGTIDTFSYGEAKRWYEEDGLMHNHVVDTQINGGETHEVEIKYKEIGGALFESKKEKKEKPKEDFDRVNRYIEYYTNLSPDDFKIIRGEDNQIIIELP